MFGIKGPESFLGVLGGGAMVLIRVIGGKEVFIPGLG